MSKEVVPYKENDELAWKRNIPVGYRFRPTDAEIFIHYLYGKIRIPGLINEFDVYQCCPDDLQEFRDLKEKEENHVYYFTQRKRKYPNGNRPSRFTQDGKGFWKMTNKINKITGSNGQLLGRKNTLVYYQKNVQDRSRSKDSKTNWIMHEYVAHEEPSITPIRQASSCHSFVNDVVLCRIYKRENGGEEKRDENRASSSRDSLQWTSDSNGNRSNSEATEQEECHLVGSSSVQNYLYDPAMIRRDAERLRLLAAHNWGFQQPHLYDPFSVFNSAQQQQQHQQQQQYQQQYQLHQLQRYQQQQQQQRLQPITYVQRLNQFPDVNPMMNYYNEHAMVNGRDHYNDFACSLTHGNNNQTQVRVLCENMSCNLETETNGNIGESTAESAAAVANESEKRTAGLAENEDDETEIYFDFNSYRSDMDEQSDMYS